MLREVNAKGETHYEHMNRVLPKPITNTSVCTVWHLTFGGRCLNCGFQPDHTEGETIRQYRGD
jgi:hypothetical protein